MGQRDIIVLLVKLFEKYKISYILTGSFAGSFWGHPRATHDIDFLVEIETPQISKILAMISALDGSFSVDLPATKNAIDRHGRFNIVHNETEMKIDFWVAKNTDFEKNKFKRKVYTKVFGRKVALISAEDLVLTKLSWIKEVYSDRHFRDCIGILERQKGKLDEKYLIKNAKEIEVTKLLAEARKSKY